MLGGTRQSHRRGPIALRRGKSRARLSPCTRFAQFPAAENHEERSRGFAPPLWLPLRAFGAARVRLPESVRPAFAGLSNRNLLHQATGIAS